MTQSYLCCGDALLDRGPFLPARLLDFSREKHSGKRDAYAEHRTSNHNLLFHNPATYAAADPCYRFGNAGLSMPVRLPGRGEDLER